MDTKLVSHAGTELGEFILVKPRPLTPKPSPANLSKIGSSGMLCDVCREVRRMPLKLAQLGRHLLLGAAGLWLGMHFSYSCPAAQIPHPQLSNSTGAADAACPDGTVWRLSGMD